MKTANGMDHGGGHHESGTKGQNREIESLCFRMAMGGAQTARELGAPGVREHGDDFPEPSAPVLPPPPTNPYADADDFPASAPVLPAAAEEYSTESKAVELDPGFPDQYPNLHLFGLDTNLSLLQDPEKVSRLSAEKMQTCVSKMQGRARKREWIKGYDTQPVGPMASLLKMSKAVLKQLIPKGFMRSGCKTY